LRVILKQNSDRTLSSSAVISPQKVGLERMISRHTLVSLTIDSWNGYSQKDADRPISKAGFKALGAAILEYPLLAAHCQFIFVPGPNDPWSSTTLPRPAIPETFTQYIRDKLPKATFTSNPARIQYFNQEIVIFREDLMGRMLRNLVSVKDEAGDMRRFVSYCSLVMWHWVHRISLVGANDTRPDAPFPAISECKADSMGMGSYTSPVSNADNGTSLISISDGN
jgi:hypothetical protein